MISLNCVDALLGASLHANNAHSKSGFGSDRRVLIALLLELTFFGRVTYGSSHHFNFDLVIDYHDAIHTISRHHLNRRILVRSTCTVTR